MRNRTLIGLIGIILAALLVFVVSPIVNRATTDTVDVIRLKSNVERGTRITAAHIEIASVKEDSLPAGVLNNAQDIIGKYAATALFSGDYLSKEKLSAVSNTAEDVFADLDGKLAISVPVSSFAGTMSGKLQNGDVIRFYVRSVDRMTEEPVIVVPPELQWVRIITTTTGGGIDQNEIHKNEDGTYEMPSTVTVLATEAQAKALTLYGSGYHAALVCRGTDKNASQYLEMQNEVLEQLEEENALKAAEGGN